MPHYATHLLLRLATIWVENWNLLENMESTNDSKSCAEAATGGVCKKGALRNFAKFTRKHLCQNLFFNKNAGLKSTFFTEHHRTTASACD